MYMNHLMRLSYQGPCSDFVVVIVVVVIVVVIIIVVVIVDVIEDVHGRVDGDENKGKEGKGAVSSLGRAFCGAT